MTARESSPSAQLSTFLSRFLPEIVIIKSAKKKAKPKKKAGRTRSDG